MKKIYQEYADLKVKAKEIDLQMKAINTKIIEDMEAKGETKLETPFGKFLLKTLTTWKYSDAVDTQKAKLVKLQEKEQAEGIAEATEKSSLTFNAPKHE